MAGGFNSQASFAPFTPRLKGCSLLQLWSIDFTDHL
jgi:hypothetical protein